jgi:DNA-binding transcriptional regulator YiaG
MKSKILKSFLPRYDMKHIRTEVLHLSQKQFAKAIGVTIQTVRQWDKGRQPSNLAKGRIREKFPEIEIV